MKTIINTIISQANLSEQEAWWLLESITNKTKTDLFLQNESLSEAEEKKLEETIAKLNNDMPLAYIIGHVPFLDLTIHVEKPILIPRPETEEWVNVIIKKLKPHKKEIKTILDIGTGSGCIALALAQAFPQADVTAIDINPQALKLAQQNAESNNIKNITFIESNLFEKVQNQTFDIIVSNPPYIAEHYKKNMDASVKKWEDHGALFAPQKGLELIEKIIKQLPNYLSKTKLPVKSAIECDPEQIEPMLSLSEKHDLIGTAYVDLFNEKRCLFLIPKSTSAE